jgi:hypothetical protein
MPQRRHSLDEVHSTTPRQTPALAALCGIAHSAVRRLRSPRGSSTKVRRHKTPAPRSSKSHSLVARRRPTPFVATDQPSLPAPPTGGRPPCQPVRRQGSPRPADQARAHLAALGAARGHHVRAQTPRLRVVLPAQQAPARQAARRQVAQIDIARRLAHKIWHMLSRGQEFAPRGAAFRLAA